MTSEEQIERLERRCRFLMVSLLGVVAIGGVAVFCGAAQIDQAKALRGESLEIVDEAGNVRIRLGKVDGPPNESIFGLVMKDGRGSNRVVMQDYAQLILQRGDGRAAILAGDHGASFQLNGRGSRPRAIVSVREDQAEMQLRDANGEVSWRQATPSLKVAREPGPLDPFSGK